MVVLSNGNGASRHQPVTNQTTAKTGSPLKTMDSSATALKPKSPLLSGDKKSGGSIKLVPFAVKQPQQQRSNVLTNGNQTATDGGAAPRSQNGGVATKKSPSQTEAVVTGTQAPVTTTTTSTTPANDVDMSAVVETAATVPPKRKKGRPPKSSVTLKASVKVKNAVEKTTLTRQPKVLLDNVMPFITCNLCKGYLIDATTIVECLHTFCHSCIMIHLRQKQYCPCCELMINKTKPNIKPDAIRQAIVYKLVPGLYEKEILRRQEFYRAHPEEAKLASPEQRGEDTENLIFSPNENISLSIEYADIEEADDLDGVWKAPKYLQCPASFTVNMLSKFIVMKIGMDANKFLVDISYKVKTIVLADYYTLMDVAYIYTWKRDTPMRFFFSVRTKETTNQELPEVPFRRSPATNNASAGSASASTAQPPILTTSTLSSTLENASVQVNKDSNKPVGGGLPAAPSPSTSNETKLKLVKKVDESPRVSDKKRVVYMVQSADNGPQISAAAAYNLLPHESTAVGVNSARLANGVVGAEASKSAKQQQQKEQKPTPATAEEGTPRYRSLVEKENAKMKKLMQSLSEEKKLLKLRKREAMKEAAATGASTTVSPNTSLKMKITKSDSGLLVIQNSCEEAKDVLSAIGSVANCDVNDEKKKALFLQTFQLKPKKTVSVKEQKTTVSEQSPKDQKKSISFGFSSYEFGKSEEADKDAIIPPLRSSTPKAADSVKQTKSPQTPSADKTKATKSNTALKRNASDEKLSPSSGPQPKKKFSSSSYVKIAPKEMMGPPQLQPKLAPKPPAEKSLPSPKTPTSVAGLNKVNSPAPVQQQQLPQQPMMAPPMHVPPQQLPHQRTPNNGSIYAFLQPNPSPKTLFKPMNGPGIPNLGGFSHSQFQTMPSPIYMTNANAGSTPIYTPNSPSYTPSYSLSGNQQFKYAKLPTYMTNFSLPSIPMQAPNAGSQNPNPTSVVTSAGPGAKVPGLVVAKPKMDPSGKVPGPVNTATTTSANSLSRSVGYLNKLPPPPIFSPSSGMSITTTTTTVGPSPPPLAVLPKRSPDMDVGNAGKRKKASSPVVPAKAQSPAMSPASSGGSRDQDPPEKQRKVQSLLDSCNITFPSSLSITIANESEDGDKSGPLGNKLKNPVNNYIEILKIPSGDPANCSSPSSVAASSQAGNNTSTVAATTALEQNNKFPLSATSNVMQQKQGPGNLGTFASSSASVAPSTTTPASTSGAMKPPTPPPPTTMKLGSTGSMSITPAITSNLMHLIKNGNAPKDSGPSPSVPQTDQKRKSPPLQSAATTAKRPSPSPPQTQQQQVSILTAVAAAVAAAQKTPGTSTGDAKKPKAVPKLMPKLNPIEKVPANKTLPAATPAANIGKPTAQTSSENNGPQGAAAIAAAAISSANETFQREFLKFAKDKPETMKSNSAQNSATKAPAKHMPPPQMAGGSKAQTPNGDSANAGQKGQQRKSPVKIKPKSASNAQQQKNQSPLQPLAPHKPQAPLPELRLNPPAIAPFPLASQQQLQQQQQQQQQQLAAAALFKMMLSSQQQKLAALQQQTQFPTALGDLMIPNPMAAMFNNPPSPQQQQQQQQQQQLNSLLQQAFYQEQMERMKQAGKEALEQYAQNIQQEANSKLAAPKTAPTKGKQQQGMSNKGPSPGPRGGTQGQGKRDEPPKKSSTPLSVVQKTLESGGGYKGPQEDSKKSPKPLQMNNNNQGGGPIKPEEKKDVKA